MYKIIFFGTSDFAVPSLKALLGDPRFEVAAIVTQPDRPVGRHAVLTAPPVKMCAMTHGVMNIKQPEKLSELQAISDELKTVDAFVVVSYGKILPQWLLDHPKRGVINVHGSLLPRWRGASPLQAAIAAGDKKTGVTIMKLDAEMDHGPIIATAEEKISLTDTGEALHDRLADLGAHLLVSVLADYLDGNIELAEQDHAKATYCKILTRDDGKIDWTRSGEEIERLVRAYHPWPGTWMEADGKRIKILESRVAPVIPTSTETDQPGTRLLCNGEPCVTCGDGTVLQILKLQSEGKKPIEGKAFLRGFSSWEK
jgi:methionyl-tRNA formyltransferase